MNTLVALAIRCSLIFLVPTATDAISAQWNPTSAGLEYACQLDTEWRAQWTKRRCNLWPFKYDRYLHLGRYEVNAIVFTSAATNPCTISVSSGLTLTLSGSGITNNSGIQQNFNGR
jgi:hypothetical protein